MNNFNQRLIERLLEEVLDKALQQPDKMFLFVAECIAWLAMQEISDEEMCLFEQEAYNIIDTYTVSTELNLTVIRNDNIQ